MKELFDFDYLGKDLTGNAEIQSAVDRGLAFMKLEKWDKALQVFDNLIDMHPESPCGWFGKARLVTNSYTVYDLTTSGGRSLVAEAASNLEAAVKVVEEERKEDYLRLQATFSDYMKKYLTECYISSFSSFTDVCESVEKLYSNMDMRMFMICDAFSKASANGEGGFKEDSIYAIPPEIIVEAGNDYPSLKFAALHIIIINEAMKPYFEAQRKQANAKAIQEVQFDKKRSWNARNGFGNSLDSGDISDVQRHYPVHELSYYYKYSVGEKLSLAKFIKDNSVFENAPLCDERMQEVFRIYFRLFKIFQIPIGDLKEAGVPDKYYQEIEGELQQIEKAELEEKRQRELRLEKEKAERAAIQEKEKEDEAARKARKIKSTVFLCIAIFLGYCSLSLIPALYTGNPLGIVGIVTLILCIVFFVLFIKNKKAQK